MPPEDNGFGETVDSVPTDQQPAEGAPQYASVAEAVQARRAGELQIGEPEEVDDSTPEVPTPESTPGAAPPAPAPASAPLDPFEAYGGQAAIEDAIVLRNGLQTEQGVRTIVAQGLTALGYNPAAVAAFLNSPEGQQAVAQQAAGVAPAATPVSEFADDDLITGQDLKGYVERAVAQAVEQTRTALTGQVSESLAPLQQQWEEQRSAHAQTTVRSTLAQLIGEAPADPQALQEYASVADTISNLASQYISADDWDPIHIAHAVRQGHAAWTAQQEAAHQFYLRRKQADAAGAPVNIGGTSPGGEEHPEPQSAKEAVAMRKAMGIR